VTFCITYVNLNLLEEGKLAEEKRRQNGGDEKVISINSFSVPSA
jgi:hypothetical protein